MERFIVTATHVNYYHICKYKLWLFANGITMEHTSQLVALGKGIHERTFRQRAKKYTEIQIEGSKIDFYNSKQKVIHEVKKSDIMQDVDIWQLKYYILLLHKNGVADVTGKIEYPLLREVKEVYLDENDIAYLENIVLQIRKLITALIPPRRSRKKICSSCAYYDFCWLSETK